MIKGEIFERMQMMSEYFEQRSKSIDLYIPESITSQNINSKISALDQLTQNDVSNMISLIENTDKVEHHNGSHWFDYKLHFTSLMAKNGFDVNLK